MNQRSEAVSHLALDWLREVLHTEFSGTTAFQRIPATALAEPAPPGAMPQRLLGSIAAVDPFEVKLRYSQGQKEIARWYRDWHRGWRRFQLSDRLRLYAEQLLTARRPEDVFRALTEQAVQIVGGYTCLLFPPQSSTPLRSLPNPKLSVGAERLTISIPLPDPGMIHRDQVLGSGVPSDFAPLFMEDQVVAVAHAPFGDGGLVVLVERRREREFQEEDWEMLRVLAKLAEAAYARVQLSGKSAVLVDANDHAGVLGEQQLEPVLGHAITLARAGEALTLAAVTLTGLNRVTAEDGPRSADRVWRSAAEGLRDLAGALGIVVKRGDDGFFLVLPRLNRPQAIRLVQRLSRQLPSRVRLRIGVGEYRDQIASPTALIDEATADIERDEPNNVGLRDSATDIGPRPRAAKVTELGLERLTHRTSFPLPRIASKGAGNR